MSPSLFLHDVLDIDVTDNTITVGGVTKATSEYTFTAENGQKFTLYVIHALEPNDES